MDEFSKFDIPELNTGAFIVDEFLSKNSPDPSLEKFRDLLIKEIEKRTHLGPVNKSIEDLRSKYLGQYMGYRGSDSVEYFKVDEIEYVEGLDIITIGSKLILVYYDEDYTSIQYTTKPCGICDFSPQNLDMRDFFMSSSEEFKEKLNKIIRDGLK